MQLVDRPPSMPVARIAAMVLVMARLAMPGCSATMDGVLEIAADFASVATQEESGVVPRAALGVVITADQIT